MSKKNKGDVAAEPAGGIACVVYEGPHAQIQLRNVPGVGELTLVRDALTPVPPAAGLDLVRAKKVRAATREEIAAHDAAAAAQEAPPSDTSVGIAEAAGETPIGE